MSFNRMRSLIWLGAATMSAAIVCGCGRSTPSLPPVVPAALQVSLEGKPAVAALIVLHPVNEPQSPVAVRPRAVVRPDGTAPLTTFHTDDGAPAGEYIVTATWHSPPPDNSENEKPGPDRLRGRHADPQKSKLRAVVQNSRNEPIRIELKTSP